MKVLPTARILIVDSQVERREALRNSLIAFGVGGVQEAGSLEAAAGSMATGQPDVLIVHADNPDQIPENPYRDGNGAPRGPGRRSPHPGADARGCPWRL